MPVNYTQNKSRFLYKLSFLVGLLLLWFTYPLSAQEGKIRHIDTDDGLAGLMVYRGLQSSDGYMWFATDKGVCRHDGELFKTYSSDLLPDSEIIGIWEFDNKIWFNNLLFQLFYLEDEVIKRFNPDNMLTDVAVSEFYVDSKGRYWLLCGSDLYRIEKNDLGRYEKEKFSFEQVVKKIFQFKSGEVGIVVNNIRLYDEQSKEFVKIIDLVHGNTLKTDRSLNSELISFYIGEPFEIIDNTVNYPFKKFKDLFSKNGNSILTAENGYWLSSNKGVFKISKGLNSMKSYTDKVNFNRINNMVKDRNGDIWFCTNGEGIYVLQNEPVQNLTSNNSSLPSSYVYDIVGDGEGHVFVATKNGWISEFKNGNFINYKISESNEEFYELIAKDQELLFSHNGTYTIPINEDGTLAEKKRILFGTPKSMTHYKNDFWLAHYNGIFKKYGEEYEKISSSMRSYAMHGGYDSKVWIGTLTGLYYYDYSIPFQSFDIEENKSPRNHGSTSSIRSKKNLVFEFDKAREHNFNKHAIKYKVYEKPPLIKFVSASNELINDGIAAIQQTKDSLVWVLTKTKGLFVIDRNNEIKVINKTNGLLSNAGNCLYVDEKDNVWVGTAKGLSFCNGKFDVVENFTTANGLLSNNVTSIYKDKNRVLVGTNKGLSVFEEKEMKPLMVSEVVFQDIQIQSKDTSIHDSYKLKYNQNNIFIDFVSVSYDERLRYKYVLEGRSDDWIEIDESYVRFSDLASGSYVFKVKAISGNKTESEISKIHFEITPPFWKTGWFFAFCTFCFLMLLTGLMKKWSNYIEEKANQKSELNRRFAQLELQALQSQMNPHFIFNVLNSIQNFILREDKVEASNYLSKFAQLMRLFLESSRSNYINLKDELELLKLYIELERLRFQNKFDFQIIAKDELDLDFDLPSMLLQPFLENAINHGLAHKKDKGTLTLKFLNAENGVYCFIEDDGVGQEKANLLKNKTLKKHKSHGMQIVKERLHVLNLVDNFNVVVEVNDLYPKSNNDKGTQVKIFIPTDA